MSESTWDYPFTQEDVAAWKQQHGKSNIHLVTVEDEPYVVRGLKRAEFQRLSDLDFRNDEHMEDVFVSEAMLYPQMTETELRNLPGGVSNNLFDSVMEKTNIEAWREKEILKVELSKDDMDEDAQELVGKLLAIGDFSFDDLKGILANPKNHKRVYITEFEGTPMVYKGLSRSEYERIRTEQRDGKYQGPASEEELCGRCVLYPFKFNGAGDDWLHGTVSSLSLMVMRVSGFGATKEVVTL